MSVSPRQLADSPGVGFAGPGPASTRQTGTRGSLLELIEGLWRAAARCSPRAFLVSTVVTFLLCVFGMLAFSWYANPWGNYGPTGYHRTYNVRLTKANYLDGFERDALPKVVVLGSSTSMRYSPTTIEQRLGKTAFNFAVAWGCTEDFLCIVHHLVKDLDHRPNLLIIGLSTWTFGPTGSEHPVFTGLRRRLLNTPQLVRHHPEVSRIKLCWSNFIDAFSRQQLKLSWKLIHDKRARRTTYATLAESDWFAIDGTLTHYCNPFGGDENIFDDVEAGRFPITEKLRTLVAENRLNEQVLAFPLSLFGFEGFSEHRIEWMERMLRLCDREEVGVVFVINPIHPVLFEVLSERTPHARNLERLKTLLAQFERDHRAVRGTLDASRIASFGGDPDGFSDPYHPASRTCDLIIDRVAELLELR